MNIFVWCLQVLTAIMYASSGTMKVFMFEKISADVPSFGALPRKFWTILGIIELICIVGLIVPAALHWHPVLTIAAAAILAIESLVFIWVHTQYSETVPIVVSAVLGLIMAFIAYARAVLVPIA